MAILIAPCIASAGSALPGIFGRESVSLPVIAPQTLPGIKTAVQGIDGTAQTGSNLTVYQNQSKAIVDWNTFNIGSDASVYFNQQGNTNWAVLNRIWDNNPSQIYGRLSADGRVYLINQNGILFGQGSQVNVHTLIASTLNIANADFLNDTLRFTAGNYTGESTSWFDSTLNIPGAVSNHGSIITQDTGSVFLIGSTVENNGIIISPSGQIGLIAGTDVELALPVSGDSILYYPGGEARTTKLIKVHNSPEGSLAWNMEGGSLVADTGLVGMYGSIVNHDGLICAATAVRTGGHVELFAARKITTGAGSLILLPVLDDSETFNSTFETARSDVTFGGLDPNYPGSPRVNVEVIEHNGIIDAPSGLVTMNAIDRVYLASGSSIDVSGLWLDYSGVKDLLEVTLTTANLADEYSQKGGFLQGKTIRISSLSGSAIGNVSEAYSTDGTTNIERHTTGGSVVINVAGNLLDTTGREATGDIIIMEGAVIDFSGGGINYGSGYLDTTKLVSGNKVYDISSADSTIAYDSILNDQTVTYSRYGIVEVYEGVYSAGGQQLLDYVQEYTVGSDAGSLTLQGTQIVLDGTILGEATRGIQQTLSSTDDETKRDYVEPKGGTLIIGNTDAIVTDPSSTDFFTKSVVVSGTATPLSSTFKSDGVLTGTGATILSAGILSSAGLSKIAIAANTGLTIESGARITLNAGGAFDVRARRIENYGSVTVPGGSISFNLEANKTTGTDDLSELIYLAPGSLLSVAGEQVDNLIASRSSGTISSSGHIDGGSVSLIDQTLKTFDTDDEKEQGQGVIIMPGATVDVSGGWLINTDGEISGGDAGSLALQGYSLIVAGDLRAYSLLGNEGGSISAHAYDVVVSNSSVSLLAGFNVDSPWPSDLTGKFIFTSGMLDGTGFTNITLSAVRDLVVENGAVISPSKVKMAAPSFGIVSGELTGLASGILMTETSSDSGTISAASHEIGSTSVTLNAGLVPENLVPDLGVSYPMSTEYTDASLVISPGSTIEVAPGGSVTIDAPYVDIAGTINAPAGDITAKATYDLVLHSGAQIIAEGYNKLNSEAPMEELPLEYTALDGGSVTLTAGRDLILAAGSLISVSGSSPVQNIVVGSDGTLSLSYITDAGQPGSIYLEGFKVDLQDGSILAGKAMFAGLAGGTLSVSQTNTLGTLSVSMAKLAGIVGGGFDALTLASSGILELTGSGRVVLGRELTLSSPVIKGGVSSDIALSAPWVQLRNDALPSIVDAVDGDASIRLSSTWLDITGDVMFSGFENVYLYAFRDMRLTDAKYTVSSSPVWSGLLRTSGDLALTAGRIYPTTLSEFIIETPGKVTILPSGMTVDGPIYSAGGSLTIRAEDGIEHRGYLAAPMGTINLSATDEDGVTTGRVYLADGSVTTTRGDVAVSYGSIVADLGDNIWAVYDKANAASSNPYEIIETAPEKSISITGNEVIVRGGAVLDISGGGSVFTYQFLESSAGTTDPLKVTGRYVIMPDNSIVLPGNAVYLAGGGGIAAGVYSLLPEEYAFLPGAVIITIVDANVSPGQTMLTKEGYTVIAGYETTMGTGITSQKYSAYAVRSASDVLMEGTFEIQGMVAGNAGRVTLAGSTTILDGTINAAAFGGYRGGSIVLSGDSILVQTDAVSLPSDFGFNTAVSPELAGTLNIAASSLSGKGFETIGLGFTDLDDPSGSITALKVTLGEGVVLEAEKIILAAKDIVTLETGAQLLALASSDKYGEASLISPDGLIFTKEGSVVHASDKITLEAVNLDIRGTLLADNSALDLKGSRITFVDDGYIRSDSDKGLFITTALWDSFASFESIGLIATGNQGQSISPDIIFSGDFNLATEDSLTLDAALIKGLETGSTVTLSSQTIRLLNTGSETPVTSGVTAGQITFNAQEIEIGNGDVLFDVFSKVDMNALNNLTFKGEGSLGTGGADLNISSARVTTSYYTDSATGSSAYQAANFKVDAGDTGTVKITNSGGTAGTSSTPGGSLEIAGKDIEISSLIETLSGQLKLTAVEDIYLKDGAGILATGTAYAPGGAVYLKSTSGGSVNLEEGSFVDVSAGAQGDAGSLEIYAPTSGVALAGEIKGTGGETGVGGSFALVTASIDDFGSLNDKLYAGEFNETLDIRARTGNIIIGSGDTVRARDITITSDGGAIDLAGTIDASSDERGGNVELSASGDLVVSGNILAAGTGTDADGGDVYLSVDGGMLYFNGGALIDVSGSGSGTGGTVTFRDPPPSQPPEFGDYQLMMSLAGTITGASSVSAVIDSVYQYSEITTAVINTINSDITTFMDTYGDSIKTTLLSHLTGVDSSIFHLTPGVVIENSGDLTLANNWDLSSWRYGGEVGVLTLRSAGDLTLNASIIDNTGNTSTSYRTLRSSNAESSWGINLIAGAQLDSADLMAVVPEGTQGAANGTLTISSQKTVYTETGGVRFASGGDTVINDSAYNSYMTTSYMKYSLATYAGAISGNVEGDLTIEGGGAIQSAVGNIDITTGGDLVLGKSGSYRGTIRTTGEAPGGSSNYNKFYSFTNGGDINLDIGGSVKGGLSGYWLTTMTSPYNRQLKIVIPTYSTTATSQSTEGIVAMGGGSIYARSGGSFNGQAGTFGTGDLSIYSGGDLEGRFLVNDGTGILNSMGNFGTSSETQLVEMSAAQVRITAQGNIDIGAVLNPDLAAAVAYYYWDNSYTPESSLSIVAVTGDVNLYGEVDTNRYGTFYDASDARNLILPPSLEISAGGDINVNQGSGLYVLLPSSTGNLAITAGGDIVFLDGAKILMSDADPAGVYVAATKTIPDLETYASSPVHLGDSMPVVIAATGSIIDMDITVPKMAAITAGKDITDLNFSGQNIGDDDVTSMIAGGSIFYGYSKNAIYKTISLGGPGWLIMEAGGDIDLGNSEGIKSVGNYINQALDSTGSSIIVAAGLARGLDGRAVKEFFDAVREAGKEYTTLKETDSATAMDRIERLRAEVIVPFIGSSATSGDIDMTSSQISTTGGGSLFVIAAGSINVGKTVVSGEEEKNTGIFTSTGGEINVYASGDVNVNESRIMTFRGGDITVYSDTGDINAGKGSRAVISMSPPTYECEDGVCKVIINPPAVGSGIRAMTYDPDGSGPLVEPEAGWLYVFAPGGIVDAGEAGMMGSGAYIGATSVLNTANMSFAGPSVGVPAASQGTSLGALTGSTNLGDKTSGLSEDAAGLDKKMARGVNPIEDVMKWVEVKVTGFDLNSPKAGESEEQS